MFCVSFLLTCLNILVIVIFKNSYLNNANIHITLGLVFLSFISLAFSNFYLFFTYLILSLLNVGLCWWKLTRLWMISSKEGCFLLAGVVLADGVGPAKAWSEALLRLIYFSFTLTLRAWSLPMGCGPSGFLAESLGCYSGFRDLLGVWTPASLPSTVCLIEFQLNSRILQLLFLLTSWSLILCVHSLKDGQWLEENL